MTFLPILGLSELNLKEILIQWMILVQTLMQNNISATLEQNWSGPVPSLTL